MANSYVNTGIVNNYSIKPRNLTQYTAFRGVTDFSQIGQFSQFERGYSFLSVLQMPKFMVLLGQKDSDIGNIVAGFKHKLEYEFRGLEGLADITADYMTITDGINEQRLISKVTEDTSITVSSQYYETQGAIIEKFTELYLTGIKDPKSQAKTYHGLIKNGILAPGPENEVFTMLYYVTDSTMLRLERAFLLVNCQLTTARRSELYNATRADIGNNVETTIEWNCYPLSGAEVDKIAKMLLEDITGVYWDGTAGLTQEGTGTVWKNHQEGLKDGAKNTTPYVSNSTDKNSGTAVLDSAGYRYGIMDNDIINGSDSSNSDKLTGIVPAYADVKNVAPDVMRSAVKAVQKY